MEGKETRLFEFAQKLHDLMKEYDIGIWAYMEGELYESYISGIYLVDKNDNELLLSSEDYVTYSEIADVLKAKGE